MLHRFLPKLVSVLVKNKLFVFFCRDPSVLPKFAFELIWLPTRVTKGDKTLVGALSVADVAQNLQARCHGYATIDVEGFRPTILWTVQHETDLRLDRASREDTDAPRNPGIL